MIFIIALGCASVSHGSIEQSLRFYTNGSLINATTLPTEGPGIVKIRKDKNRTYGTAELISILSMVSKEMDKLHPKRDRLQVGDIANLKGGSIGQHKSHHNGLDADVVYYRKNNKEQNPDWPGNYVERFVQKGQVSANFDLERNWTLLTKLTSFPQVERIFVDISIKKAFCKLYAKNNNPAYQQALRILRPASAHDDHMHIRISCPPGSPRCLPQGPPAEGNGCSPSKMELDLLENAIEEGSGC